MADTTTDNLVWRATGGLSGLLAAALTRKALTALWRARKHDDPPANPASPQTSWTEAVTWAAATGVALGVARLVALRGAAAGWQRATGALPPGLEDPA
jgi:hypothetical protein